MNALYLYLMFWQENKGVFWCMGPDRKEGNLFWISWKQRWRQQVNDKHRGTRAVALFGLLPELVMWRSSSVQRRLSLTSGDLEQI
jgi:hypothetical protein